MKRTEKSGTQESRSVLTKSINVSKAKKRAWSAFSAYIRLRDAKRTTGTLNEAKCCTCGKVYPAFGKGCLQAGHFIAGRNNAILFEETCVHAQCYMCNVTHKGASLEYFYFMEKTYGREEIDRLRTLSKTIKKLSPHDLLEIEAKYEEKAKELRNGNRNNF